MCGRFVQCSSRGRYAKSFGLKSAPEISPSYNVCPTQAVLTVAERDGESRAALLRWGFIPSWAPSVDPKPQINARAETVHQLPTFRDSFKRRRCLLPVDGIYEWDRSGARPVPYCMRRTDGEPFAIAGIWDLNTRTGMSIASCAMLTCDANALMAPVHHRMPVILEPDRYALWLDHGIDPDALRSLLRPYEGDDLEIYPVSPLVNKTAHNGPEMIEPLETWADEGLFSYP